MEHSNYIPLEIWDMIFDLLNLKTQISLISTCHYFRDNLKITDLYYLKNDTKNKKNILKKLTTDILKLPIFLNTKWLNAVDNKKINNVSFMTNLKILNAYSYSFDTIDQNGIKGLNLVELDARYNKKITNLTQLIY